MPTIRRGLTAALAAMALIAADAADAADAFASSSVFPGPEWSTITPQTAGWDADKVAEAHAFMAQIGTASFLVVQHGVVVDSFGDIARRIELHSVRKSLLSALIGMAVNEGKIHLDDTLAKLGIDDSPPSLTAEEKQATVRQLLQARSGVYHVANYETPGERAARPQRGSHAPGTFWYYNNWDFNALGAIYERAEGVSIFQSLQDRIARPISMQDYRPSDGRYETDGSSAIPAYPIRMSARDAARFGLLYLHDGRWGDQQIVPTSWVKESTTAWSETQLRSGYGYLWWTSLPGRGFAALDLPRGGFSAIGAGGQFIIVDPADDLVVVHQTRQAAVGAHQMGHLMWLILNASHAPDVGRDPSARGG